MQQQPQHFTTKDLLQGALDITRFSQSMLTPRLRWSVADYQKTIHNIQNLGKGAKNGPKAKPKFLMSFETWKSSPKWHFVQKVVFFNCFKKDRLKTASSYFRKSFRNRKKLHFRLVVNPSSIVNFNTKSNVCRYSVYSNVLLNLRKRHCASLT